MDTVQEQPENFWAYNNGLTALVNDYEIDDDNITKVHGITIINGAQSTGAIGAVESLKEDFLVPIRFIVCSDPKIIEEIINNNNKQNEILPSDLRSNDKQQVRLRKEFEKYPQLYIAVVEEIVQGLETKKSLIHIWLHKLYWLFMEIV